MKKLPKLPPALKELNIDAQIIKVTEIMDIMMYDVMSTPAIVVDEKVVFKGKVPSKEELMAFLIDNFASTSCCADINPETSNNSKCC